MSEACARLERRLGYAFRDAGLLVLALTHRSRGARNNERLEFLGDAILSMVIADALYERYPQLTEGELTRMRASLVKQETLAELAREIGLGEALALGGGECKSGGYERDSILSDALEAIIGAAFKDGDFEAARDIIARL